MGWQLVFIGQQKVSLELNFFIRKNIPLDDQTRQANRLQSP